MTWEAQEQADISWLFNAGAFRVAPPDEPFWFTSGLIGPYFIAAHYLCGGAEVSEKLLKFIDAAADDVRTFPTELTEHLRRVYSHCPVYKPVIDHMAALAAEVLPLGEVDFISGGQRRDWFFAPLIAEKLEKPCLFIYNDLAIADESGEEVRRLDGAKVANIADLLTVGSSYVKKWIPAISERGGSLLWSLNAVDRAQGGRENLLAAGVNECASLFTVEESLFKQASEKGLIDQDQLASLQAYLEDPYESMRSFLQSHPEFVSRSLRSEDAKIRSRAELMLAENPYQLEGIESLRP